jgi:hypothetical protein
MAHVLVFVAFKVLKENAPDCGISDLPDVCLFKKQ